MNTKELQNLIINYELKIIKSPAKDLESFLYSNGIPSGWNDI